VAIGLVDVLYKLRTMFFSKLNDEDDSN